jgi:transcriptional regulator with XRE-family HTH domain
MEEEGLTREELLTFGQLLKQDRKNKNLSQQVLANKVGVSRNIIHLWEIDYHCPKYRYTVQKLALELGLSHRDTDRLLRAAGYSLAYNTAKEDLSDIESRAERYEKLHTPQKKEDSVLAKAPPQTEQVEPEPFPKGWRWTEDILSPFIVSLTVVYLTVFIFIFLPIWLQSCKTCFLNDYETLYFVIPVLGALFGFVQLRSRYGSIYRFPAPLMLFCLALLLWSSGNIVWTYYNIVPKIRVPYPSFADMSYFSNNLLWLVSLCMLLNYLGANVLRKPALLWGMGGILLGSLIVIMLFVRGWKLDLPKDPLKFVFDVGYPLMSGFTTGLAALGLINPSFKQLDNPMKRAMYVIFLGIFLYFIADLAFNIVTSLPDNHPWAYYDGDWPDFIYATALYVLGVGILLTPLETMNQLMTVAQLKSWIGERAWQAKKWFGEVLNLDYIFFVKKSLQKINFLF